MQGLAVLLGDELLLDAGEGMVRQLPLGRLRRAQHAGLGNELLAQVDAMLLLETVADVLEQQIVEVVAAELGVAVAGRAPRRRPSWACTMETSKVPPPRS